MQILISLYTNLPTLCSQISHLFLSLPNSLIVYRFDPVDLSLIKGFDTTIGGTDHLYLERTPKESLTRYGEPPQSAETHLAYR